MPGTSFEQIAAVASGVESRGPTPVPPVVRIKSTAPESPKAAKRFSITSKGKVKRRKGFLRHQLSAKTRKQKRHLGKSALVDKTNERAIKRLLPYL